MELLERAPLLDELAGLLAGTAAGGRVVLLAGEAGMGKSVLVRELAERHAAEARFLVGACDPLLTPRALGPLHDLGRQAGGRLAALLAAGSPREQLFDALLDELDRRERPQVVVVEDAHWADEATLDLLVFLGRRMKRIRALLLVTYRDDELAADHPLLAVPGSLPPGTLHRLWLAPLSEEGVAELGRRAGRPTAGLRALTGGNPLLVTEVLAAADTGVPPTVRDLVLARLAGLAADAQEVVPGRRGPDADRAVAAGAGPGAAGGGRRGLPGRRAAGRRPRRGRLPPRAAPPGGRGLAVGPGPPGAEPAGPGDAGRRPRAGGRRRPAGPPRPRGRRGRGRAPVRARGGQAGGGVAAHREAAGHYRAALASADRLPAEARADLLEGLWVEAYLSGLAAAAVSARTAAVALREADGDLERVGEGLRWLSRLHWWDDSRQAAEAAAARAVAVLETLPPGHQLAMAYSHQAQLDMLANRLEPALAWAGRALELARRLDDRETLTHALTNIGSVRLHDEDQGGRADLEEAFAVAEAAGFEDHAARALVNLATVPLEVRRYGNAHQDLERAIVFAKAHDLTGYVEHLLGNRGRLRLEQGDWAGAEQDAQAALAERVHTSIRVVEALTVLGLLQARRGDPAAAATLQEATERAFATSELQWLVPVAAARAEHAWLDGDDGRAAEEADRVLALATRVGQRWYAGELAMWLRLAGAPRGSRWRWRWRWRSRTGCCWPATGGPAPTPGGSSAAPTTGPWPLAAATGTRPCLRRCHCWTASGPGRRPSGCAASSASAATCASPAARPGPRPPTRPASPTGRSRCSGCSPGAQQPRDRRPAVAVGQDRRAPCLGAAGQAGCRLGIAPVKN